MKPCRFKWESEECCNLPFHECIKEVHTEGPHVCVCGERLKLGAAWEVGSSINHRTGERRTANRAEGQAEASPETPSNNKFVEWPLPKAKEE